LAANQNTPVCKGFPNIGKVYFDFAMEIARDEMTPSVDAAKKIAKILNTTVGYLLGETDKADLFKDPEMLKRLNEIEKMDDTDKGHILSVIDGFIKSIKLKNIAAL